jgi:hypothetical protein
MTMMMNVHKPVVFYKGKVEFREGPYGTGEYALVYDVVRHPSLGSEHWVYTSEVVKHFDGGFETANTVYIKMPSESKEPDKTNPVEEVMSNFDFGRVETVMKALNWYWARSKGVPDIITIRNQARYLLEVVNDQLEIGQDYTTGTGGFEVTGEVIGGQKYLTLKFIVEEWSTDDC